MLYLKSSDCDLKIIVLESGNIERMKQGHPIKTQDGSILIAWTPDPVWLADQLMDTGGDPLRVAKAIEDSMKRPEKGPRPYHKPHLTNLATSEGEM